MARTALTERVRRLLHLVATLLAVCLPWDYSAAVSDADTLAASATVNEKLNGEIDLNTLFIDTKGTERPLKDFFLPGRPVLITPVYYGCSRVCTHTLNGTVKMLNQLDLKLGDDFSVITFTIDPTENFKLAGEKAFNYYQELKGPPGADSAPETVKQEAERGWHFLTGSQESIQKLTDQLGFVFTRDGRDFSHAAVVMVLTPEGRVSKYFYGVEYRPSDMRFALIDAAKGKIGTTVDRILLFCYRFDHLTGRYSLAIWKVTQIICGAVVVGLSLLVLRLRWKERKPNALQVNV